MLFTCVDSGIKHRFLDASHQAVDSQHFPVSVGLRSQALKLRFATRKIPGRFLKPTQPLEEVMSIFKRRFTSSTAGPVFHQAHIGETISLIYSPFYIEGKIFDAVLNKAISPVLPEDFDVENFPGGRPGWQTRFIPAMCPACGWDLEGQREALILICYNCNTVWRPAKSEFKPLKFAYMPAEGNDIIYLPFWRIKADVAGLDLQSYADLVATANLPRAMQPDWNDIDFYFWALAFKVRPEIFIRLARNITLSQPQARMVTKLPAARLYPVTLPLEEALESLTLNLASFVKPQKEFLPQLQNITVTPRRILLVYIPFREKHHEYIQSELHLTINKNHLRLAGNL